MYLACYGLGMPSRRETLTELKCRNAKAREKDWFLSDPTHPGLLLKLTPAGKKIWVLRYKFKGQARKPKLGHYPDLSLADARAKAEKMRAAIRQGSDPSLVRQEAAHALVLGDALALFLSAPSQVTVATQERKRQAFKADILPTLGRRPAADVTRADVLALLKVIEARGAGEQAARTAIYLGQAYDYLQANELVPEGTNPARLARAGLAPRKKGEMKALPLGRLPAFLHELDRYVARYNGTLQVEVAFKLLLLTMVRPGEVREARWSEFHLDSAAPVWVIPAERMKMKVQHVVPLSRQAVALLRTWRSAGVGEECLFAGAKRGSEKPISDGTLTKALRYLGFREEASAHGFRNVASTYLNNRGVEPHIVEACLAHREKNSVKAAYARTTYLAQRRLVMQFYADTLDAVRAAESWDGVKVATPDLRDVEPEELPIHLVG